MIITSCHGLSSAIRSTIREPRLWWSTIFVISSLLCLFQFSKILNVYFSHPTTVLYKFESNRIPFPAVTICNTNGVKINSVAKSPELVELHKVYDDLMDDLADSILPDKSSVNFTKEANQKLEITSKEDAKVTRHKRALNCPSGWISKPDHCYRQTTVAKPGDATSAIRICKQMDPRSSLAVFRDITDYNHFQDYLFLAGIKLHNNYVWIGGTNINTQSQPNIFIFHDPKTNWDCKVRWYKWLINQPNCLANQYCILSFKGQMNDLPCTINSYRAVCQIRNYDYCVPCATFTVENGNVNVVKSIYAEYRATTVCKPNHNLTGRAELICQLDGQWDSPAPVCELITTTTVTTTIAMVETTTTTVATMTKVTTTTTVATTVTTTTTATTTTTVATTTTTTMVATTTTPMVATTMMVTMTTTTVVTTTVATTKTVATTTTTTFATTTTTVATTTMTVSTTTTTVATTTTTVATTTTTVATTTTTVATTTTTVATTTTTVATTTTMIATTITTVATTTTTVATTTTTIATTTTTVGTTTTTVATTTTTTTVSMMTTVATTTTFTTKTTATTSTSISVVTTTPTNVFPMTTKVVTAPMFTKTTSMIVVSTTTTSTTMPVVHYEPLGTDDYPRMGELALTATVNDMQKYILAGLDEETLITMGYTQSETIFSCTYEEKSNCEWKAIYHRTYGNCYTYNFNKTTQRHTTRAGIRDGFFVEVIVNQDEYTQTSESAGIRLALHDPQDTPYPETDGYSLMAGYLSKFSINYFKIDSLPAPYGNCISNSNEISPYYYNDSYSVESCQRSFKQLRIIEKCGCAAPHYERPNEVKFCNLANRTCVDLISNNASIHGTHCKHSCINERYSVTSSVSIRIQRKCGPTDTDCKNKILSGLRIYYTSMQLATLKEFPLYTNIDILCDFGGNMGFFLGASFISGIELIYLGCYFGKKVAVKTNG